MATMLIKNGRVVDGSGEPGYYGSLLIEDAKIKAVFKNGEILPQTDSIINANGLVIAPGFIDMHSHADWVLPSENHPHILKCLLEQGITTVVGGNCGISPAPIDPEKISNLETLASIAMIDPLAYEWHTMDEFLNIVSDTKPILNLAELAGHSSIRYCSANTLRGAMEADELNKCLDSTRQAFDEGASGLSFGLGYDPGMYSPLSELEAFCTIAAEAGKPVTVHLKALSKISPCYPLTTTRAHNVLALEEMLNIARRTKVKLQISHFIFVGRKSWPTAERCIRMVEEARQDGIDVMIDAFPITCGNTFILAPFPYWFLANIPNTYQSFWARLRLRLELTIGFRLVGFTYKDFQVMDAAVPGWEHLNGLRITEIAREWNCSPFAAMVKLAETSKGATLMLFHAYSGEPGNESVLEKVLSNDLCLFETDVAIKGTGYPNPAGLGTFPRILGEFVRERKLFSLENVVKRMTSASAERFGLSDIGLLQPGKAADIVLFNPDTISDTPEQNDQPAGKPKGLETVIINGQKVVEKGSYMSGVRAGRVLR